MPELPEVETIVRILSPRLSGRRIDAVPSLRQDIVSPADFELISAVSSRTVTAIHRRGKKIIFELDDGNRFYIHLGMSGRLTLDQPEAPLQPHTHMVVKFGATEMRFVDPRRFGGIFWLGTQTPADAGLGPEPLEMRPSQLARGLAKTRRAIKTALLDQKLVAGLGNIYADESLFDAKIHPLIPANKLSPAQISRLSKSIKAVLKRAIHHKGSTLRDYRDANGESGNFQKIHRVYNREGKPCPRCGTPIKRIVVGARSTHFCPRCQAKTRSPLARG